MQLICVNIQRNGYFSVVHVESRKGTRGWRQGGKGQGDKGTRGLIYPLYYHAVAQQVTSPLFVQTTIR